MASAAPTTATDAAPTTDGVAAPTPQRRWDAVAWILLVICVIGSAIRYAGIGWGLPLTLHADEWVIVEYAIEMAERNSFEPAFFARPDHLEIQLSYLAYQLWSHGFNGTTPEVLFAAGEAPFYAISRAITATFGSAMIPLAYLLGRPFHRVAGVLMAFAVAFFPPFVEHSRYATPDIPLTFTVMLVMLATVLYLRRDSWWLLALASFAVALGITAKYPAVLGGVAIAAAVIIDGLRSNAPLRILTRGAASLGLVAAFTFVLSPVLFTNSSEVRRQLFAQNTEGHLGASGLGWTGNLAYYAEQMLISGGPILLLFAGAGTVWCIIRRRWEAVPLFVGLVFWVAISRLALHWDRWGLPMYVTIVLVGALGVYAAWEWSTSLGRRTRQAQGVIMAGAALSGLSMLAGSLSVTAVAFAPDTRAVADAELAERGVTAENTAYDGYTPFLPDGPASVADLLTVEDDIVVSLAPDLGLRYVLTSSTMAGRFLAASEREESEVYRVISETLTPVQAWSGTGGAPHSIWEPLRIVEAGTHIARLASGGLVGPRLTLYELPVGD